MAHDAELRIGLYICHCGHNIAGVISPEELAAKGQEFPQVVVCRHHLYSCSEAGQADILKDIKNLNLNRLVVAACTPKLHEVTFRRLLAAAGLNPYLLEMVNIREQCTWVHPLEAEAAQAKALELIRMGLAKVRLAAPLEDRQVPVVREALVIGGGPAGLRAALDLAQAGYPVTLVERQPILGGMASRLHTTFPRGESALSLINPLMAAVVLHPRIRVLTSSEVVEVKGHVGNFTVIVRQRLPWVGEACDACGRCAEVCPQTAPAELDAGLRMRQAIYLPAPHAFPGRFVVDPDLCDRCGRCVPACPRGAVSLDPGERLHQLQVGGIVVATGFSPFSPAGSRYAPWAGLPGVITTLALERLFAPEGPTGGEIVVPGTGTLPQEAAFVMCVGSREEEGNRYCSRVCCPTALKQAVALKQRLPRLRVRLYHRDIRTVKKDWEALYTRARELGVRFIRGEVTAMEEGPGGRVVVRAFDETLQTGLTDLVDLAVLAVGMVPGHGAPLREVMKLPVGPDGFFLEAHPKLKPLETVMDGIFLAGACQGPKDLAESLTQGSGAAAKLLTLLAHDTITLDGLVARVDEELCIGCGACVRECPFQAMELVGEGKNAKARVITAACKGCGVCAGACPSGAAIPAGFTDDMIMAQIEEALAEAPERKILAFCCNWCSYAGADFAGVSRLFYPPQVRIIRLMCAGRLHPKFIWHAFELGAGRVLVSGCHPPGDCHYISGNLRAQARLEKLWPKLAKKGIDPGRLRLAWVSATEGKVFQQVIQEMAASLGEELEPLPVVKGGA
jgi:heterodisulfide reductase subunit A